MKLYYIIEEIDIDGDRNSDGMLISQYRIDKHGDKIFLQNKYVSFADFYKKAKDIHKAKKSKYGGRIRQTQKTENNLIVLTEDQFNQLMNKNGKQEIPSQIMIHSENPTFLENVKTGVAYGTGATIGNMGVEIVADTGFEVVTSFFE